MYYNLKPLRFLNKSYTDAESVPPPDVLVSDDDPYVIRMDLAAGLPLSKLRSSAAESRSVKPGALGPAASTAAAASERRDGAPKGKHVVHHGISVEQFQQLMK
jgi:hypothetical protein